MNVYKKNNVDSEVIDKKSLEEYLELYINFKLKVKEAEAEGLDTVSAFIKELNGYRKQLAQPYLIDEDVNSHLMKEAYKRMLQDIRASHILIRVSEDALPADTIKAYKRIMKLRERLLNGEDFGALAVEASEDPSAKDQPATPRRPMRKGNKGDLGYFTVFDMLYPFETGAYTTPVDEISEVVRTKYGYHLIKVNDKKEALGKIQVAHILLLLPKNASAADSAEIKEKVMMISQKIKEAVPFEELVKEYSDDPGTKDKGGVLPWFGCNRMIPDFIKELSLLKNKGDVTEPFLTDFGWHIVKFIDRKKIGSFEDLKTEIKQKIAKNDRAIISKESMINKIKQEYNFTENTDRLNQLLPLMDESIFKGQWDAANAKSLDDELFSFDNKKVTIADFAGYIEKNQASGLKENLMVYLHKKYDEFVEETLMAYEDSKLEAKYPDFKMLMKEYRDGILLFELTDQKIWSMAIKDTAGLEAFYDENKDNYKWEKRLDATIYTVSDPEIIDKARKMAKKEMDAEKIVAEFNNDENSPVKLIRDKFEEGDNEYIDAIKWKKGLSDNLEEGKDIVFVFVHDVIEAQNKKLDEARGIITADYQNYLEKQWIKELREKYDYKVNKDVFSQLQ